MFLFLGELKNGLAVFHGMESTAMSDNALINASKQLEERGDHIIDNVVLWFPKTWRNIII